MSKLMKLNTLTLAFALAAAGCTQANPIVDQVQVNLVDKGIFEGEWWLTETVADLDGDGTTYGGWGNYQLFPGGSNWGDYSYDESGISPVIGRIRWVIDEDFLYAYRSFEIIDGGNDDGRSPGFRGQPLAAFAIEAHVDIQRGYNSFTGEENRVLTENTSDRRWYERDYMRVDWSSNSVQSFTSLTDIIDVFGAWRRESAPFQFDSPESHPDFPRAYAPQFVTVGEDPDYRWASDWPADMQDTVHYMSFTTMTLFSPGATCLFAGGAPCQTFAAPMRVAFLRVPPNHEYASAQQPHVEFDRFGLFRTWQRTYVRGGQPQGETAQYCDEDTDCGAGGHCELDPSATYANRCVGGLTEDFGETDLLAFYRPRHNFFSNSLTEQSCDADWECDGRYGGSPATGSVCDRAANRCTIPVANIPDEDIRQVTYHLNDGYPAHLVDAAYEVMGNWNEVFMRGMRAARSLPTPDYSVASIPAQADDPTGYCFADGAFRSPEVRGDNTCAAEFDPFVSPDEWASLGVSDPFDCQIVNTDGFAPPARPTSYDEYPLPAAYRWEFQGSECLFVLKSNACDLHRADASIACDDVTNEGGELVAWEQQGDIRYQFFNYVDQVGTLFGGVSEIRVDPTNGEIITADVNYGSVVSENLTFVANEWLPVLRCVSENGCAPGEEGADERYLDGENTRAYFEAQGRVERPVAVAPNVGAGTGGTDPSRPAGLDRFPAAFLDNLEERAAMLGVQDGPEARGFIFQDRLNELAGTEIESRFLETLDSEAMAAMFANGTNNFTNVDPNAHASDMADMTSPFRASGRASLRSYTDELRLRQQRERIGIEYEDMTDVRSFLRQRYWEYWSEAFRGRTGGEASIRLQQQNLRGVMHHEVGHSVGLRHNFGGSVDRDNFGDGYHQITIDQGVALPDQDFFDLAENGGDEDGVISPTELEAYQNELNRVRIERARLGAHNHMTASIMDYNGDHSDVFGLGHYDKAAIHYSYFDLAEAYVGDPRVEATPVRYTLTDGRTREIVSDIDGLEQSHTASRVLWTRYRGGELCDTDMQCPYAAGSGALVDGQVITQRCVANPRNTNGQIACSEVAGNPDFEGVNCVCSTFEEDFRDYTDGAAYNNDVNGDGEFDFTEVNYLFCSDERTNDISWCSRFDVGESFQEMISHYRRNWYERYAGSYNRRFRRSGPTIGGSIGSIVDAVKIFQHFYFRYFYEPGFRSNSGPLGVSDQIDASLDAMNWLVEMVNLPTEGSYAFNAATGSYELMGTETGMAGADFSLSNGAGFPMWTSFQEGHQGFFRAERAGVFYDKYYALLGLALRDWGLSFTIDERFFINFYDLFPLEMTEFFGGQIIGRQGWYAPRVDTSGAEPVIRHPQLSKSVGSCTTDDGRTIPCFGNLEEVFPGEAVLGGTSNIVLRTWAATLALAQFAVYYDSSFEQRLIIYRLGDQNGHQIPDTQPDTGAPACAYGAYAIDGTHDLYDPAGPDTCNEVEDANYAVYFSERLHTPYVAVKVRARLDYNPEEEQLGFQVLRQLIDQQDALQQMITDGAPAEDIRAARIALEENESFLQNLMEIMSRYGISNQFGF